MGPRILPEAQVFKPVVYLRTCPSLAAVGLLVFSVLLLMTALVPADRLTLTVRATLSQYGVSKFHVDRYVTLESLAAARRKLPWLALACLGLAAGTWWKGEVLFSTLVGRGDPLPRRRPGVS
jgi:hypothetical protein